MPVSVLAFFHFNFHYSFQFNLAIKDIPEVTHEAKKALAGQLPGIGRSMCVEISLKTSEVNLPQQLLLMSTFFLFPARGHVRPQLCKLCEVLLDWHTGPLYTRCVKSVLFFLWLNGNRMHFTTYIYTWYLHARRHSCIYTHVPCQPPSQVVDHNLSSECFGSI